MNLVIDIIILIWIHSILRQSILEVVHLRFCVTQLVVNLPLGNPIVQRYRVHIRELVGNIVAKHSQAIELIHTLIAMQHDSVSQMYVCM